ncbi:metal-sensitive transcriptional regulator [Streptomyces sp. WAC00263]|uniref:metal-sensitive transcriptional regulator n=1 Tax=Streptomyces sp. WAC00263 TaxID=1917422 RepID=UPI0009C6A3E2|nr:metal-sensitive transcriptional regulator [Streptomyces sp. WAC00263]KAF5990743.1 hypothetical protein BOG92_000890 [Streptomyces sp. WAC00263]
MVTVPGGHDPRHAGPGGVHSRKEDHLARMHRVEGQVRGVTRMVEDERYCIDILTQISAVTHALQEVALGLLDDHARHCVLDAARLDPETAEAKLDEMTTALRRTLRL